MAHEAAPINEATAFQSRVSKIAQGVFRRDIKATGPTSMQRPFKEDAPPKQMKVKQTVSAAALFKKKPKKASDKKHRSQRQKTPEPEAVTLFTEGLEDACSAIIANGKASFDSIYNLFMEQLDAFGADDATFSESISSAASLLTAPLAVEKIQITVTQGGESVTRIVGIGSRISKFKELVEKEQAKLKKNWKQWEDLQDEFRLLGAEVFGAEAVGLDPHSVKEGFKREMDLIDLEHNKRFEELVAEHAELGAKTLEKMDTSEKELEASAKKLHAKMMEALLE